MKAISVRQPWARAIACGQKTTENRGRACAYRGLIAIHASRTPDLLADEDRRIVGWFGRDPRVGAPVGAVIAVADLVDCHLAADYGRLLRTCCQPWGEKTHVCKSGVMRAWHLVLKDVRALPTPVYCPGKVMVPWELPADVEAQVWARLGEAVA